MKVIASSLRKGNIVDIDGKLGVIVTIESIHPGKGTPVTQMDVRRIADGVGDVRLREAMLALRVAGAALRALWALF